nr:outer membrane protein assembly factor BamA [Treponema sp.]
MYFRKPSSIIFCIFMLFMAVSYGLAQDSSTDESWYYGKPIRDVTFEGLDSVKKSDLDGVISSYIGQPFSDEVFSDLFDRIYSMDLFESLS